MQIACFPKQKVRGRFHLQTVYRKARLENPSEQYQIFLQSLKFFRMPQIGFYLLIFTLANGSFSADSAGVISFPPQLVYCRVNSAPKKKIMPE